MIGASRTEAHDLGRNAKRAIASLNEQERRRHGLSARQLFVILRERLMASRPLMVPERTERASKARYPSRTWPAVYGKPTFQNRIDENGKHV